MKNKLNYLLILFLSICFFGLTPVVKAQINTVIQSGHFRHVSEIAVDYTGRYCATTDGKTIKTWDLKTGIEMGEVTTGSERNLPIKRLAFLNDTTSLTLSFVMDNRLIFKDVRTNRLIPLKKVTKTSQDSLSELEIIKRKYSSRESNYKQMKRYDKAITKLNKREDNKWQDYIDEMPTQDCRVSKTELAYYDLEYEKAKWYKWKLNAKKRTLKRINKKANSSFSNPFQTKVYELYDRKWERSDQRIALFKSDFKKKEKRLIKLPDTFINTHLSNTTLWMNDNETYAVIGKALINLREVSRSEKKVTKRIVGLFPDNEIWNLYGMSPNEKVFVRCGHRRDSTDIEIYDLTKVQLKFAKSKDLKKDTAYFVPRIKFFRLAGVKSVTVTDDLIVLLKQDGEIVAYKLSDWSDVSLAFYPKDNELEPFTSINAFSYNPRNNTCLLTGITSKYQNICFRSISMSSLNYSWSVGSEFAASRLSVLDYSNNRIITSVNTLPGANLNSRLQERSQSLTNTIGFATLDLSTLNTEGFTLEMNGKYSPNFENAILQDSTGYYFLKRTNNARNKLSINEPTLIVKWSDDSRHTALYQDSALYIIGPTGNILFTNIMNDKIANIDFHVATNRIYVLDVKNNLSYLNLENSPDKIPEVHNVTSLGKPLSTPRTSIKKAGVYNETASDMLELRNDISDLKNTVKGGFKQPNSKTTKNGSYLEKVNSDLKEVEESAQSIDSIKTVENRIAQIEANDRAVREAMGIPAIFEISEDGERILYFSNNCYQLGLYDLTQGKAKRIANVAPLRFGIRQSILSAFHMAFLQGTTPESKEWASLIKEFRLQTSIKSYAAIDSSWNTLVYPRKLGRSKSKYVIKYIAEGKNKLLKFKSGGKPVPFISPSGKYLALSCSDQTVTTVRVYDLTKKGKCIKKIIGHAGSIYFSPDEKHMATCGNDNQLKVWDITTENFLIDRPLFSYLVCSNSTDALIYDDKGYFMTKNPSLNTIAFNTGGKTYPLEQFDLIRNRPDSIMLDVNKLSKQNLNSTSFDLLKRLTQYRLESAPTKNIIENPDISKFPGIEISNVEHYNGFDSSALVKYSLNAPSTAGISAVEIFNNNIPWKTVELNNVKTYDGNIELPLMYGANNLKFTAISSDGARSLSKYAVIRRKNSEDAIKSKKRHVVLIGIDNYSGATLPDLNRPTLDCKKLEDLFSNYSTGILPENLIVHKLFNESATTTAVQNLIDSLENTDVNDEVIFVLAGHGRLKGDFEFVIPEQSGNTKYWSYNQIMKDIGRIKAGRKLVLIDACHSGLGLGDPEFDPKAVDLYFKMFFNYSIPSGVQVISSAYSTQKAADGYFYNAIEEVLTEMNTELTVTEFFNQLQQKNKEDLNSQQKFSFTNSNPLIQWSLFSKRK